jgi:hypothetical protein
MTDRHKRTRRAPAELAGIVLANAIKVIAAGRACLELLGPGRASVLGGCAFLLTVALSLETSVNNWFAGRR